MSKIPADELSKRFFYAGCFGLPWLWIVHTFHWYGKLRGDSDELLVNNNGGSQAGENEDTVEQISLREMAWVGHCRNSAIIVTLGWIAWIVVVQVFLDDDLPSSWFVRAADQSEYTGW